MTESSPFIPVRPLKPAAPYIGGKRNLARRLIPMIEAIPHKTYAEPFVGMGGVFLRRRQRPPCEVINDWSRDVWTLCRVLQEHYPQFMEVLRFQITSRSEFERLMRLDPATLTDLQRAARFLYLQKTAFGGKVAGRHFGVSAHRSGRMNLMTLGQELADLAERYAGVIVENLPFADFIRRYDRPETLFYIDPPYWGCEGDYGPLFGRADFEVLLEVLRGLQGPFLLSINDVPETRALFQGFEVEGVEVSYGLPAAGSVKARELIVQARGRG